MIDPSFWRDEKIAKCSYMERLLFEGLWTFAEDSGVGRANPLLIKADVFPYDCLTGDDIRKALDNLHELGLIFLYEHDGQQYYFVLNFLKHQTINKPTPPTLPLPEEYRSATVGVRPEDKINISKEEEKNKRIIFTPPCVSEVSKYCKERNNSVDPERFVDYYSQRDWVAGSASMTDWKAAVRGWEKKSSGGQASKNRLKNLLERGDFDD